MDEKNVPARIPEDFFFCVRFPEDFFSQKRGFGEVPGIPVFFAATGFFCMNSCGTGIPVFAPDSSGFLPTLPDSCSRQKLSGLGQQLKKTLC